MGQGPGLANCECSGRSPHQGKVVPAVDLADITVQIVRARGLRNADRLTGTLSDAYVVMKIAGKNHELHKTRVIDNCLNPVWHEEAQVVDFDLAQALHFSCWDEDFWGLRDSLGTAELCGSSFGTVGFNGELRLEGSGASLSYLQVRVKRLGEDYPPGPPPVVDVKLRRHSTSENWGLDLDCQDGVMLFVCSVAEQGPVRLHNENVEPWQHITPGDFIESINGVKGDALELIQLCSEELRMDLVLRRSCEFSVRVCRLISGERTQPKFGLPGLLLRETPKACSLVVQQVTEEWQPLFQDKVVKPLDRIIAVDGVRGDAKTLLKELQNHKDGSEVNVTFTRPAEAEMPFRVAL